MIKTIVVVICFICIVQTKKALRGQSLLIEKVDKKFTGYKADV